MDRRDSLRIEVNELKKRLGINMYFKKLNSIEECRKAFVEIAENYANKRNSKSLKENIIKNLREENQELKNYIEDLEADKQEITFLLNAKLSEDDKKIKNKKRKWWLW